MHIISYKCMTEKKIRIWMIPIECLTIFRNNLFFISSENLNNLSLHKRQNTFYIVCVSFIKLMNHSEKSFRSHNRISISIFSGICFFCNFMKNVSQNIRVHITIVYIHINIRDCRLYITISHKMHTDFF